MTASATVVPATLFAIVATYQVRENYNLDDPKGAPYWKCKGGHTVVVHEGLELDALNALSYADKEAMVIAQTPESDEYFDYSDMDWELVTLNSQVIEDVRAALANCNDDVGYARYQFAAGDVAFDWACRQEPEMVEVLRTNWNSWEINNILRVKAKAA